MLWHRFHLLLVDSWVLYAASCCSGDVLTPVWNVCDFWGTIVTRFSVMLCRPGSILCARNWPTCLRLTTLTSITNYTNWPIGLSLRTGRIRVLNGAAVQRAMYIKSINSTREMDVRPASIEIEFRKAGLNGRAASVKVTSRTRGLGSVRMSAPWRHSNRIIVPSRGR
jgi:lambda repressor-like predicted transcriptional regulator